MGNLKHQSIAMHNALAEVTHYRPEMVMLTQPNGDEFNIATMLPDNDGEWVKDSDVRKRLNIECAMKDGCGIETR